MMGMGKVVEDGDGERADRMGRVVDKTLTTRSRRMREMETRGVAEGWSGNCKNTHFLIREK